MEGYKSPLASVTIWGAGAVLLTQGANMVGWALSPDDATTIMDHTQQLIAIAGSVVAIWGRVRAKTTIGKPSN